MDIKKIALMTGGVLGSFIVMIVAMYFLYPFINPEKKEQLEAEMPETKEAQFDPAKYGTKAVDSLNKQVANLQKSIDSLKTLEADYVTQIDSLEDRIEQELEEKQKIQEEIPKEVTAKNLEDVSKSLLNLDEDSLSPIVNLLEDKQLVGLYNSANSMQRAKLLRSLKPDKAATILKKVM